jgi:glycosyltransferase involved in cell wall biosynthesis
VNEGRRISVVIPARNEKESLPAVLDELPKDQLHEILVVDGHSTDGTADVVRGLGYRAVTQTGRGYGMGVISGIKAATGDLLTFMDADGSYDPEAIARMLAGIEAGNDFVFCSRYMKGAGSDDDTIIRLVGNMVFTFLMRLMFGVRISDSLFFYALGKKSVFEKLDLRCEDFALCIEVPIKVHRGGFRYTEIPSRERPRIAGVTKVNAFTDGLRILGSMIRLRLTGK